MLGKSGPMPLRDDEQGSYCGGGCVRVGELPPSILQRSQLVPFPGSFYSTHNVAAYYNDKLMHGMIRELVTIVGQVQC